MAKNKQFTDIQMMYDGCKNWDDGEGSYTALYHCPVGKERLLIDFDCTPGFGEVDSGFQNPECYKSCVIISGNIKGATVRQKKECPFKTK